MQYAHLTRDGSQSNFPARCTGKLTWNSGERLSVHNFNVWGGGGIHCARDPFRRNGTLLFGGSGGCSRSSTGCDGLAEPKRLYSAILLEIYCQQWEVNPRCTHSRLRSSSIEVGEEKSSGPSTIGTVWMLTDSMISCARETSPAGLRDEIAEAAASAGNSKANALRRSMFGQTRLY